MHLLILADQSQSLSSINSTYYIDRWANTPNKLVKILGLVEKEIMEKAGIGCNETLNTFLGRVITYRLIKNLNSYGK